MLSSKQMWCARLDPGQIKAKVKAMKKRFYIVFQQKKYCSPRGQILVETHKSASAKVNIWLFAFILVLTFFSFFFCLLFVLLLILVCFDLFVWFCPITISARTPAEKSTKAIDWFYCWQNYNTQYKKQCPVRESRFEMSLELEPTKPNWIVLKN